MKPSPYFTDSFRYFFKRFASEDSLRKWFIKRAGGESSVFNYPEKLTDFKNTLVILPNDKDAAVRYIRTCKNFWSKKSTLILAPDSLRETLLREEHPAEVLYLRTSDYRFGELEFQKVEQKIAEFKPELCLYFAEAFLPALYLARHSNAPCRIGFEKNCYPFLNISLIADSAQQKSELLKRLYGGCNVQ